MSFRRLFAIAVLALLLAPAAWAQTTVVGQDVILTTSDDVRIHATYYGADKKGPAVILLHMMRRNRADWSDFVLDLKEKGISALAIDLRGHGSSVMTTDGKLLKMETFSNQDFAAMVLDVEAAMKYLRKQDIHKQQVGIIGASIGANVALNFAAKHHEQVMAVAMLSPGLAYRRVTTELPLNQFKGPVFLVAAEKDVYSANSVRKLSTIQPQRCKTIIYPGERHGTNLLSSRPELTAKLIGWMLEQVRK